MKLYVRLNPRESTSPAAQRMPTPIEQVRVADGVGFDGFSMEGHHIILGLQRLNQIPPLARLCAEAKRCGLGTAVMLLGLRHPVTVASLDVRKGGKSFFAFGLGCRDDELNLTSPSSSASKILSKGGVENIKRLWMENSVSFTASPS